MPEPTDRLMIPINEIRLTLLTKCWECGQPLDTADVPWWECEQCGRAFLVSEAIVERIDLPDKIKGKDPGGSWHAAMFVVMTDGSRMWINEDDTIPVAARSMEVIYRRRTPTELAAAFLA